MCQLLLAVLAAAIMVDGLQAVVYPINGSWPAGRVMRGTIVASGLAHNYSLLGVGYCRGGPPGGAIATSMVSYVRLAGVDAPSALECLKVCDRLSRCAGVELRASDDWCELQIPLLTRVGDGTDKTVSDWMTGADAAAETSATGPAWDINAVPGSPPAVTTATAVSGFYCWQKLVDCSGFLAADCDAKGRYPCTESYYAQQCGPCVPLYLPQDGSDARVPADSTCLPDESAFLPTLKVALASPWFGGKLHEEALYLTMIYGVRKAWMDRVGPELIPIEFSKRLQFPFNITGHVDEWAYTLSTEELNDYGLDPAWNTRIENHPMSGARAMTAFMQDQYSSYYGLMEPADEGRTRPHAIIGSTSDNSLSGVFPHAVVDLPISHLATFYETPVVGWFFNDKEFTDKTIHPYYMRMNRIGLDYHLALARLIKDWGYTRVGIVTSGTSRQFVRGLQESLGSSVQFLIEDMNLQSACMDTTFSAQCYSKVILCFERLRELDARIIIHEQDGATQLDTYFTIFADLFNKNTLLIQINVLGDCATPMIPPTNGEYGLAVLWENIRRASNANNRGEWEQMPAKCRVCPNWAARDGVFSATELSNFTLLAEYNLARTEGIYAWQAWCPELQTLEDILQCKWCNRTADFWIAPSCTEELDMMRTQLSGSLCVGVLPEDNPEMIEAWADYFASLSAQDLVAAGAPKSFFDIFEPPHPLYEAKKVSLADKWSPSGSWRRQLREKAALVDSLLFTLVAFNKWVRAAGDSQDSLSAVQVRSGFRTTQSSAIPNWLSTMVSCSFEGLTGYVKFNENQERISDYMIYSAQGEHLAFKPVGRYDTAEDKLTFFAPVTFNNGSTIRPPDREPPCLPGEQYLVTARGCVPCEIGYYCIGGTFVAIPCGVGTVAPFRSLTKCVLCPVGTFQNSEATLCLSCPPGRHAPEEGLAACSSCEPGRFWKKTTAPDSALKIMPPDATSVSSCELCPRGTYQDQRGQLACQSCPIGRHTPDEGSVECSLCERGRFWRSMPAGGNVTASSCEMCSKSYYQDELGMTACKSCPGVRETFNLGAMFSTDCLCPFDTYLPCPCPEDCSSCVQNDVADCLECPEGMDCELGSDMATYYAELRGNLSASGTFESQAVGTGNFPKLLPRYWAAPDNPVYVYMCLDDTTCPGGTPRECNSHTTGLMCVDCEESYYRDGNECRPCTDIETSKLLFPIIPCILGPVAVCCLYAVSRTPVQGWSGPLPGIVNVCIITLMHFQILGLMYQCNLFLPKSFGGTWGSFSQLNQGLALLRPSCAGIQKFEERYYLNVIWPLLALFMFVTTFVLTRGVNGLVDRLFGDDSSKKPVQQLIRHRMDGDALFSTYGNLMETFFIGITVQSLALFHCYNHPNGKESLHVAPEILCDSDERQNLLVIGIIALVVYVTLTAAILFFVLCVAPNRFWDEHFRKRWKFLLSKYKPDVWYWGAAILVRSLLLSLSVILFKDGIHQLIWILCVLVIYLLMLYSLHPWRHLHCSHLDITIIVLLMAAGAAMLHFTANPNAAEQQESLGRTIERVVQVAAMMPCIVFMGCVLHLLTRLMEPKSKRKEKMRSIFEDLQKLGPALERIDPEQAAESMSTLSEADVHIISSALDVLVSEHYVQSLSTVVPTRRASPPLKVLKDAQDQLAKSLQLARGWTRGVGSTSNGTQKVQLPPEPQASPRMSPDDSLRLAAETEFEPASNSPIPSVPGPPVKDWEMSPSQSLNVKDGCRHRDVEGDELGEEEVYNKYMRSEKTPNKASGEKNGNGQCLQ